jgi:hypothetical protein
MTPLDKSLKRALTIDGHDYVVALTPDALKITRKGHRLGVELKWAELVSGQSALAVALNASLGKFQEDTRALPETPNNLVRRATATSPSRSTATGTRRVAGKRSPPKRSR